MFDSYVIAAGSVNMCAADVLQRYIYKPRRLYVFLIHYLFVPVINIVHVLLLL